MSEVVYNEDLVKRVENKYLAVNVAAKRARDINANGLPIDNATVADRRKKPVAIATQELVDGKLDYKQAEAKPMEPNTYSLFSHPVDDEDEPIFDEDLIDGADAAHAHEDIEEPEEGL